MHLMEYFSIVKKYSRVVVKVALFPWIFIYQPAYHTNPFYRGNQVL